jgi:hypothetical protein
MKNFIYTFVILAFAVSLNAQWQPDVRLSYGPGDSKTSWNNAWCVAANGNVVHVVYYDYLYTTAEIFYKRSTDGGVTWGGDKRLTNNSADSKNPSIAVAGSVVHVVWREESGEVGIYYTRSTDGGNSFEGVTRLTDNTANSYAPSIIASGSYLRLVWEDSRDGNREIYYKRSTNGGTTWGADTRLTNNTFDSRYPSIKISGTIVHVVWYDLRNGNGEIYYKRSADGGINWGTDTRLTNNSAASGNPSIAVSGSNLFVVWEDNRDGNNEIYIKRSTDEGINWGTDTRLTNNSAASGWPSIVAYLSNVHVVWQDYRDVNSEIYYKRSSNGGTTWGTDTRLTNNSASSGLPSIAVSGSLVHIVWEDNRDTDMEVYYKRNPTGNSVGINNISTEIPSAFSLSQNYPNPFNPTTKIRFTIPLWRGEGRRSVSLKVFDITGREIQTLVNENLQPGTYESTFDGSQLTSGVYFYCLQTKDYIETKKLILLK